MGFSHGLKAAELKISWVEKVHPVACCQSWNSAGEQLDLLAANRSKEFSASLSVASTKSFLLIALITALSGSSSCSV